MKALVQANKNGYFYAFDRTNGRFLYARPFISRINCTKGLDEMTSSVFVFGLFEE